MKEVTIKFKAEIDEVEKALDKCIAKTKELIALQTEYNKLSKESSQQSMSKA